MTGTAEDKDIIIAKLKSDIAAADLVLADAESRYEDLEYELEREPEQAFCRRCFKPFPSSNGRQYLLTGL